MFFHAYWRTSSPNISCQRKQFLDGNKVAFLVSRNLRSHFQVNFMALKATIFKVELQMALLHKSGIQIA